MIILGFPGIGKTTAAKKSWRVIDLDDLYSKLASEPLCSIVPYAAKSLSDQGYDVLVPWDEFCQRDFEANGISATIIFPAMSLYMDWVDRLYERQIKSGSTKDYDIWRYVRWKYSEMIVTIEKSTLDKLKIATMKYDLLTLIEHLRVKEANEKYDKRTN